MNVEFWVHIGGLSDFLNCKFVVSDDETYLQRRPKSEGQMYATGFRESNPQLGRRECHNM